MANADPQIITKLTEQGNRLIEKNASDPNLTKKLTSCVSILTSMSMELKSPGAAILSSPQGPDIKPQTEKLAKTPIKQKKPGLF